MHRKCKMCPLRFFPALYLTIHFSSVQLLSRVQLFETPWTAAHQASLSITNSQSLLRLTSIESVMMPSSYLILCRPLLLLPPISPTIIVFWLPHEKSWLIGKDSDAGKDWGQDGMVGWHHRQNGNELEQTPRDSEGQGSLACWSPWGCRVGHDFVTKQQIPVT